MPVKYDYHIHTTRCKHAAGVMEDYVEQAIRLGLSEIAFTDHIPLPGQFDIAHRMAPEELDAYVKDIDELNRAYPEINILTGIEADYYEGFEEYTDRIINQYPFDLVLMAVHFIRDWPEGNWVFNYDFEDKPLQDVYSDYLKNVMEGIKTGLFNVVAHLDLVKMSHLPLMQHNGSELRELLQLVRENDMALEINTSGRRKTIGEFYPAPSVWPLLKAEQVPLTVGSDAHSPVQVGLYFEDIDIELQRQLVRFRGKEMITYHPYEKEFGEF